MININLWSQSIKIWTINLNLVYKIIVVMFTKYIQLYGGNG